MHLTIGRVTLADENFIVLADGLLDVVTDEFYHLCVCLKQGYCAALVVAGVGVDLSGSCYRPTAERLD